MFNKSKFNKTAFNRSVSDSGINVIMLSSGVMTLALIAETPIDFNNLTGTGHLNGSAIILTPVGSDYSGSGTLDDVDISIHLPLQIPFVGSSSFDPGVWIDAPYEGSLVGSGNLEDTPIFYLIHMEVEMSGSGTAHTAFILEADIESHLSGDGLINIDDVDLFMPISVDQMTGSGYFDPYVNILVPYASSLDGGGTLNSFELNPLLLIETQALAGTGSLTPGVILAKLIYGDLSGTGTISGATILLYTSISANFTSLGDLGINYISNVNEMVFSLTGLIVPRYSSIIIDTDTLDVYIDGNMNVTNVTKESEFFEIQPGETQLTFTPNSTQSLSVSVMWQNRWL